MTSLCRPSERLLQGSRDRPGVQGTVFLHRRIPGSACHRLPLRDLWAGRGHYGPSNRRAHRYPFHDPDGRCLLFRNREDLPVTDLREEVQKRGQTDEESSSSVILCRKTRMRIKRQPGLRRIQSRKSGKAEGENGHSISILPAFLSSWRQT